MTDTFNPLSIDRQIDCLFEAVAATDDAASPVLKPALRGMARDVFALTAWALVDADVCFEGDFADYRLGKILEILGAPVARPLESGPNRYFCDEGRDFLAPGVARDVSTVIRCSMDSGEDPKEFAVLALGIMSEIPNFSEDWVAERCWARFNQLTEEYLKRPESAKEAGRAVIELCERFLQTRASAEKPLCAGCPDEAECGKLLRTDGWRISDLLADDDRETLDLDDHRCPYYDPVS